MRERAMSSIDPRGEVIAGPATVEGILVADGDLSLVRAAKAAIDIAGHYSRPGVFRLEVDPQPWPRISPGAAPIPGKPIVESRTDAAGSERAE